MQAQKLVLPITLAASIVGGALILGARVGAATEQFHQMGMKLDAFSARLDHLAAVAQRASLDTVTVSAEIAKVRAKQEIEARDFDVRLRLLDDFVRHRISRMPYLP